MIRVSAILQKLHSYQDIGLSLHHPHLGERAVARIVLQPVQAELRLDPGRLLSFRERIAPHAREGEGTATSPFTR